MDVTNSKKMAITWPCLWRIHLALNDSKFRGFGNQTLPHNTTSTYSMREGVADTTGTTGRMRAREERVRTAAGEMTEVNCVTSSPTAEAETSEAPSSPTAGVTVLVSRLILK